MTYQSSILDLIAEGERLRDLGIQQSIDHADHVSSGWSQKAFTLFTDWIKDKGRGRQFTIESFRVQMELEDKIQKPPSLRSWGAIAVRASKAGLIKKVGHATVVNIKAHRCFASLWEVA